MINNTADKHVSAINQHRVATSMNNHFIKTNTLNNEQLPLIQSSFTQASNPVNSSDGANVGDHHNKALSPASKNSLLGKLTEIITSDEEEASLTMLLPLLAALSKDDRWFAWVSPPKPLPRKLLQQAGIALDKVMLLYPDEQHSALNIATKALSAGTCHAVISWGESLSELEFAHLQRSAQKGASHGILIRKRPS
jgi:cell division inhibitor SulA